ncbi:uncharacterized protein LOC109407748 [Aedes albopictus]|uniref:F-box domain-containing protein n=1 Tax=Aedes albopictus TaxID=7160 RepID=A0ABM1Y5B4_AEDAL|nr:uncharacterized protein LOC109407748 [Aedes albopictus]KXJ69484.1 hypothetical protein RP20_CCG026824 [Aedes albopictus]
MASKRRSKPVDIALPNEIWLEIFNNIDYKGLLNLTLVCKHWNKLIFSHMAGRFVLSFDVDQLMFPQEVIGMVPDRHYRHLCVNSFRLNSLNYLFRIVKQLAGNLDSLKLRLKMLDCQLLELLLPLLKRLNELDIKATYVENGETTYRKPTLPTVKTLKLDIANRVSIYKLGSLEWVLLSCIPNVQKLTIFVHGPQDLPIIDSLAPQLKVLKASVDCDTLYLFFQIRLPALTSLDLTVENLDQQRYQVFCGRTVFQPFLLQCKNLKSITLEHCEFDEQPLPMIFNNFPELETLELYGYLMLDMLSLSGIEKMKKLKRLVITENIASKSFLPSPSVQSLGFTGFPYRNDLIEVLRRFPNLKYLTLPGSNYVKGELQAIPKHAPQLKHLIVNRLKLIKIDLLEEIKQMVGLRTVTIEVTSFSRDKFRLLKQIIVLPELRTLTVKTSSNIPIGMARSVAATNPACKLLLNKELVKPPVPRLANKRKRRSDQEVESGGSDLSTVSTDVSASGSSSMLSVSSSSIKCSSPSEGKRMFLDVSK